MLVTVASCRSARAAAIPQGQGAGEREQRSTSHAEEHRAHCSASPVPSDARARLVAYSAMSLCEGVVISWLDEDPPRPRGEVQQLLAGLLLRALAA
ncbi:MAG: hypothetical protein ACYDAC_07380 [Candidatus Dormibacteria bacterium]